MDSFEQVMSRTALATRQRAICWPADQLGMLQLASRLAANPALGSMYTPTNTPIPSHPHISLEHVAVLLKTPMLRVVTTPQ